MKYVIAELPDSELTEEQRVLFGRPNEINTEEQAIKQAAKLARGKNIAVGIFKIVKQVNPPNVDVIDVE